MKTKFDVLLIWSRKSENHKTLAGLSIGLHFENLSVHI